MEKPAPKNPAGNRDRPDPTDYGESPRPAFMGAIHSHSASKGILALADFWGQTPPSAIGQENPREPASFASVLQFNSGFITLCHPTRMGQQTRRPLSFIGINPERLMLILILPRRQIQNL
jgi:hypothetical protein